MRHLLVSERPKFWHAAIVIVAVGVAVAGYWKAAAGIVSAALLLAVGVGGPAVVSHLAAAALPDRPVSAVSRAEWAWVPIVARYAVISAPGFYAAIKLADVFEGRSAVQALSAVAAFAFIEVVKVIDLDGDRVDALLASRAKELIQDYYLPQFEPAGPLPQKAPIGLSDVYLAVHGDDRHGGWTGEGRVRRARDVQVWIDAQQHPIPWSAISDRPQA